MIAVIQRVSHAAVHIENQTYSQIGKGYAVLLGICNEDTEEDMQYIVKKILTLRLHANEKGDINTSIDEVEGEVLLVSQFTLCADTSKGRRPSFMKAMHPDNAEPMYLKAVEELKKQDITVKTGKFGAMMNVEIHNYGPVTIVLDSKNP
jgi:D-tyrosyl-tRNA(Tyr) deacylase